MEHRLYPGNDTNIELQYGATDEDKKKDPLFSLNSAMEYLRRFRANGSVQYKVITQYGDYDYETVTQTIGIGDATAGSTLYIGPNQSNEQLQAMPCMQRNYAGYTGNNEFQDSDLVKVKFIWNDSSDTHTRGLYRLYFKTSDTTFDGIGVTINRMRTLDQYQSVGTTFLAIMPDSGTVTFTQCVFRNAYIEPNGAGSPSPILVFYYKEAREAKKQDSDAMPSHNVAFNLDNLNYFALPCVFVDDAPNYSISGVDKRLINLPYISSSPSDYLKIHLSYSYLVFRARRFNPLIRLTATNSLLQQNSWRLIGKWVIVYDPENPSYRNYPIINN